MITDKELTALETELNSMNPQLRASALSQLNDLRLAKKVALQDSGDRHNLHCHTIYSYNGYNYSPGYIAWLSCKSGWFAAGIVDFDVLDAVDEFLKASKLLNIRATCGMETRAFIKELADKEINSPGEPGVAYHMGVGFISSEVPAAEAAFAASLKQTAAERTRHIVKLVNPFLAPASLDFEKDAAALTPCGNVTERHVCYAYRLKAEEVFPDKDARAKFWSEKLSCSLEDAAKLVADPVKLEAQIRAKTMKKGGAGYVQANPQSFPALADMNNFVAACGAIPCIAWLNGDSPGEADPAALLDLHIQYGAAMLNIVPDRNWNFSDAAVRAKRIAELNKIIDAAIERNMPVIVGTEMNAPGLKLVDDFASEALAPHVKTFVDGAAIACAHTILQAKGQGYLSDWAKTNYPDLAERNKFFAAYGREHTL